MRKRKQKYLIHATRPDSGKPFHEGESNRAKAFRTLNDILRRAPVGSAGAVYLRLNPDLPIEDADPGSPYVQRIGCYRHKTKCGVTKIPQKRKEHHVKTT